MTFWGTLRDGTQMLLGQPREASLSYDRDAPADLLEAVFPADRVWEELTWVMAYHQGKPLFRGIVDEQNTRLDEEGIAVELVCRGGEAVLLDNEAPPMTLARPSLEKLRRRLLEPLGFSRVLGEESAMPGELTVEKGDSCWTVLEGFCRDHLGTRPYVDWEGTLHCEGEVPEQVVLGEIGRAELSLAPCKRISSVWQQSFRGGYDTPYHNPEAAGERRRYLSMQSGLDPREVIAQGERESFTLMVECPGAVWPPRGAQVTLEAPGLGRFTDCPVRSAQYLWDSRGQRTRLYLERGREPCG